MNASSDPGRDERAPLPRRHKSRYDDAFKADAVQRWRESRRPAREVARDLGVSPASLYVWSREVRAAGTAEAAAGERLMKELSAETGRLREENARLIQQCDILKRTLSILAETSVGRPSLDTPGPEANRPPHDRPHHKP